jgi:hypothetical protein
MAAKHAPKQAVAAMVSVPGEYRASMRSLASEPASPPALIAVKNQPPAATECRSSMASSGSATGSSPWPNWLTVVLMVVARSNGTRPSSRRPSRTAAASGSGRP